MTFENIEVSHIRHALRGMRNPMSGWDKSDSTDESVGPRDDDLAKRLIRAGQPHRKFMRQISVIVDITAPSYFWAELDTYKVGTVRDSSSLMHRSMEHPFTIDDFEVDDDVREVLIPYAKKDRDNPRVFPGDTLSYKEYTASDGRIYKVFKCGRVVRCSFVRVRHMKDGTVHEDPMPEKELKPAQSNTGYYHLYIDGRLVLLHRLVASVWCEKKEGCDVVDHIDGNKGNNSADNLEWVTRSENDRRKMKNGLAPFWGSLQHKFLQYKARRISDRTRRDVRTVYEETKGTFGEIADQFGISETSVLSIIRGTDVRDKARNLMFNQAMYWERTLSALNELRSLYLSSGDDKYFLSIRKLLPMGYLYRATWSGSYENLVEIWKWRHGHRLPAWHQFCEDFIEKLPHAEWITSAGA